jgi:cyclic beta-1,2-glucan synthetase
VEEVTRAASSPASIAVEWLLDNEYLVLRAADQVRVDVPPGYYRLLPKVEHAQGPATRVEAIAREVFAASDHFVDVHQLRRFVRAFQSVTALDLGELWALPAFLRLVVVEEVTALAAEAARQEQAARVNERVAAAVGSLRAIETTDWADFVESVSLVDRYLRLDPRGAYGRLDFATRDRYRHAVEELAQWSDLSEPTVARRLIETARESALPLGVLLIGRERRSVEDALGCRVPLGRRLRRFLRRHAGTAYFGSAAVLSVGTMLALLHPVALAIAEVPIGLALVAALLAFVPATSIAIALTNEAATRAVRPRSLPRLDFSDGIPLEARTLVAVPALLSSSADVLELLRQLELNHRGNMSPNLAFGLLVDPVDADQPQRAEDEALLALAAEGIRSLNERHRAEEGRDPFLLMARQREWNPAQACWMAWERKRGKLEELNRLLLDGSSSGLRIVEGDARALAGVRYVLTLDADTFLPEGAAARLIATLAHPLHQARFDANGRVVDGYTVLQPRIDTLPDSGDPTVFSAMHQASVGFDLYAHAVSDVYQDLFGEGTYAGKGLYDVQAFERSLRDRVPENALLSHDLFEGVHGRAALVTDVSVIEEYPSHPVSFMWRLHRWVRGDWQLLPWLMPVVPTRGGRARNRLSLLDRWKIFDNLRRSLLVTSLALLTVVGWWWLPGGWWWSLVPVLVLAIPSVVPAVAGARLPRWRQAPFRRSLMRTGWGLSRALTDVVFLPWQAWIECDAILRTIYRLVVSRRNLLQWKPAAAAARALAGDDGLARRVWVWLPPWLFASAIGAGTFAVAAAWAPQTPLLLAWIATPAVARALSRPLHRRPGGLDALAHRRLRRLARRTWAYFDRLVSADDHWLPPDNIQLHPLTDIARRTSPTNIGLGMLSHLVGSDLGFVPPGRLAATLDNTLDTLDRLERHRGHLLNWYDTRYLRPLAPRYVSTVDSGNLAACAIALRQGLDDIAESRLPRPVHADGLVAALEIVAETLEAFHGVEPFKRYALPASIRRLAEEIFEARDNPTLLAERVEALHRVGLPTVETEVAQALEARRSRDVGGSLGAVRDWVQGVDRQVSALHEELELYVPWLSALRRAPALFAGGLRTETPEAWHELARAADPAPRLSDIPAVSAELLRGLDALEEPAFVPDRLREEAMRWRAHFRVALIEARRSAEALLGQIDDLRGRLDRLVDAMDFAFLYDPARKLMRVGYLVDGAVLDRSHYDLYASEARLASFIGISKGDVPGEHWTHLGRPFARRDRATVLLSWAGTMFEYLMPSIFLRTPAGSLAELACRRAIDAQVRHGSRRRIPWGVSESGFHQTDPHQRYRYRAFGVSELAVRWDPSERLVTAPYASLLALSFEPRRTWRNLLRLEGLGALGPLGLYEAADYGSRGVARPRLVRSFMAHHQGMILAALANYLEEGVLVERFHRDPRVAASEYLLREAAPGHVRIQPPRALPRPGELPRRSVPPAVPTWRVDPNAFPTPTTVLSNGSLSALLTAYGTGGLRWRGRDVVRWRPDPTLQRWGSWIYVRDVESDRIWSAARAPTWADPERYEVVFGAYRVEFQREEAGIGMRTTVCVPPHGDVEIRRVTLVNESGRARTVELTSFAEVALADPEEDRRHPAFSKLFVEGRYASRTGALLLERRVRGDEGPMHVAHAVASVDPDARPIAWALDRGAFLGRDGRTRSPRGVRSPVGGAQADGVYSPLDPIMSLTTRIELPPGEEVSVAFLTAVADSAGSALATLDAYRSPERALFALNQARDRERGLVQDLALDGASLPTYQRLLTAIVFPYHGLRVEPPHRDAADPAYQESLWAGGISGDVPVVVVETGDEGDALLAELVRAQAYWERHGVRFDLVVVSRQQDGYEQPVRGHLLRLLADLGLADRLERTGGVHFISFGRIAERALAALRGAASLALVADGRRLAEHLASLERGRVGPPPFVPVPAPGPGEAEIEPLSRPSELVFDNGLGGFTEDGIEYVVHLEPGETTPAPWSNVLAHEGFGCLLTERGGGYTWSRNSGERRLTSWRNDPVADDPSEVLYLRDEETGGVWSATPSPAPAPAAYQILHRAGITSFRHRSHGLAQRLDVFTIPGEPVKVAELTLTNEWRRSRRLTATYYAEWVLGVHRWSTGPHLVTDVLRPEQALLAENRFSPSMSGVAAFLATSEPIHAFTCDRFEFLGQEGDLSRPAGLVRIGLEGRVGAFLDPCAALQVHIDMGPGQTRTVRFVLGAGESTDEALDVLRRHRSPNEGDGRLAAQLWDRMLERVHVATPEPAMDILLNRWLLYQTVACRLWARTGLYQSSGAIGFRDQLQDSLALRLVEPDLTRRQILEGARHQFSEGDVLHWWHPESDRGVRTRCSDDLLWLPFATAEYIESTGDEDVLEASVPFLEGRALEPGELEIFDTFGADGTAPLYEHCIAAIQRAGSRSPRGLPLIGTGDWNDALNRVGPEGRGESVWLAWFLYDVQTRFARIAERRGDQARADALRTDAERLRASAEAHCWDGAWYRRATFDDGTPLGTGDAAEGAIDSLTQSWAVLSGGADAERARKAMVSVRRHLVKPRDRLVLLLTPPFHATKRDPGYIRSYPRGVRENGGQYTHAATWVGRAFAAMGQGDSAEEIFRLLNPALRTRDPQGARLYRVEPYVLAGDVYGATPHTGRGGWTWYTGSAGWMYRLGLEDILGIQPAPGGVQMRPCIPAEWKEYEVLIRIGVNTSYRIVVRNPDGVQHGVAASKLDGQPLSDAFLPLEDDGVDHEVEVVMGDLDDGISLPEGRTAPHTRVGTWEGSPE